MGPIQTKDMEKQTDADLWIEIRMLSVWDLQAILRSTI